MTPIRDLVAAIVARVLDTRRRQDEADTELAATIPRRQSPAGASSGNRCSTDDQPPRRHARHSPGAGVFSR
jgi:hypothetical protein